MPPARRRDAAASARRLKFVLALYVFAAAVLPLGHHHVVCHFKSPTHCNACQIGSAAEAAAEPAVFRPALTEDGEAYCASEAHPESASQSARSGRAPPAIL